MMLVILKFVRAIEVESLLELLLSYNIFKILRIFNFLNLFWNRMAEAKRMKLSEINKILPPEITEKVLKFLNYKDINQARLICRKWRQIIDSGKLVKKASGKIQSKTMFR